MLTISKPLSANQAQTYHVKEFTSPDQSYWSRGQTVQGEWQGRLAEKYGLSGAVARREFARLSEGQHPTTAEQLVQHRQSHQYRTADGKTVTSAVHRAGWDATFSAPKSVSLTALVGGDERVRLAHREAVTAALTELERYSQARIGGNHPAETTAQFVTAKLNMTPPAQWTVTLRLVLPHPRSNFQCDRARGWIDARPSAAKPL